MPSKLKFEIVSPTELLASEEVDMVVVPGSDGDIGVLLGHTPVLSNLRPGVVDFHNDGIITKRFFVEGGFVEVTGERCTLLAGRAKDVAKISAEEANARLEAALDQVEVADGDDKEIAIREANVAKAMVYAIKKGSETTPAS